jgi:hypothetical protein
MGGQGFIPEDPGVSRDASADTPNPETASDREERPMAPEHRITPPHQRREPLRTQRGPDAPEGNDE